MTDFFEGGSGHPAISWDGVQPNTTVTGVICPQEDDGREVAYRTTKQTDMDTGEVLTYDNGDARLQAEILVKTDLGGWAQTSETFRENVDPNDADAGFRRVFIKGPSLPKELKTALKAAHVKKPEIGGVLAVTFVKKEPIPGSKYKKNIFAVKYTPPTEARAAEARRAVAEVDGGEPADVTAGGAGDDEPPF